MWTKARMVLDWQGFATGEQEVREEVSGHRIFQKKGSCSMDLDSCLFILSELGQPSDTPGFWDLPQSLARSWFQ